MINRRNFVKSSGLMTLAGAMAPNFLAKTLHEINLNRGSALSDKPRSLVVVQLGGGNDGLNTVVPYSDDTYYNLRPTLGIKPDEVLKLNENLGLHPAMKSFKTMWDNGQLALVRGVGYPNPNYSHFRSMEIWQSAQPDKPITSGWLGRYIETLYEQGKKAEADKIGIAIGDAGQGGGGPMAFWTSKTVVLSYNGSDRFNFNADPATPKDVDSQLAAARKIYSIANSNATADYIRTAALDALNASQQLEKIANNYKPAITYPNNQFANRLKTVATLLNSDYGARIYFVPMESGFDTHFNQATTHERLLGILSDSLEAFYRDLEDHSLSDSVLTMTFSEFGRRVNENGSRGTDHGSAEPMFVMGGKNSIKGGLYGQQPSLSDLDNGNLKSSVDFRSVYSTILKRWINTNPANIVGGDFPLLDFLK
jgi:uncharacterized protein (DUF1501 family)